jgi:phage terminase large subunit-like protein
MAGNASLETDAADNWKPSKKKSWERIDGIVALIMGLERATVHAPHYSF